MGKLVPINQKNKFLINFAKSLIILKGQSPCDIAEKIGVPSVSLRKFLKGETMALAPEHTVKLFYHLGLGKNSNGSVGFQTNCVHNFSLHYEKYRRSATGIIRTVLKIIPEYSARVVRETRNCSYILITNKSVRISLKVKKSFFRKLPINTLAIKKIEKLPFKSYIPDSYISSLENGTLGLLDFDAIFQKKFPRWDNIRSIANVHGIPFQDIMDFLRSEADKVRTYSANDFQHSLAIEDKS